MRVSGAVQTLRHIQDDFGILNTYYFSSKTKYSKVCGYSNIVAVMANNSGGNFDLHKAAVEPRASVQDPSTARRQRRDFNSANHQIERT